MSFDFWGGMQMIRKLYAKEMEKVCQQYDMTRAELDVLMFLHNHPERDRASDVVEFRGLTKSHVSVAAKALTANGLLKTSQDQHDRRVTHLHLTQKAQDVIQAGKNAQKAYFEKLFTCFDGEELANFRNLHIKLYEHMKHLE